MLAKEAPGEPLTLDGDALSELVTTVSLLARWRHHPLWSSLRDSLVSPDEVPHTVMTLGIASMLVDAGNGVGLVDHVGAQQRVPDLWLVPRIIERLEIEVKTPVALQSPGQEGLKADVIERVSALIDAAAGTKRGQLNPEHSGIVAIGSYHLGQTGLDQLETAVRKVLDRQARAKRKGHLIAVVAFEATYQLTTMVDESGVVISTGFSPAMHHRLVIHPAYAGTLSIDQSPWQMWPSPTAPTPQDRVPASASNRPVEAPNPVSVGSHRADRYAHRVEGLTYEDRVIRVAELAGEKGVIENARFVGCDIKGPAVIIVRDSTLSNSNLGGPSADAVLWEISPARTVVVGAILAQGCVFDRCTFMNIGFAGPPELIAKMREGIKGS
jgi:hypothetical protein